MEFTRRALNKIAGKVPTAAPSPPPPAATPALSRSGANGLKGTKFDEWAHTALNVIQKNFNVGKREFDGAVSTRWIEAKSGRYWIDQAQPGPGFDRFMSDIGERPSLATKNGATMEVHSNTPIPQHVQD